MGIVNKNVEVKLNSKTIKYYEELGYEIPKYKDKDGVIRVKNNTVINVCIEHLPLKSNIRILVKCDNCGEIICKDKGGIIYSSYMLNIKEDGKYYCNKCASKLYGGENMRRIKLKNGKSFEQWCIENNRQDILDRWDYELNDLNPNSISFRTGKKYWFKCPREIHKSELKSIDAFMGGHNGTMKCNKCNSFAQYNIDNICEDFLEKYWDYEKNIDINPFKIKKGCKDYVWIKCQNNLHESYHVTCNNFLKGSRCPQCQHSKGEEKISNWLMENNITYESQKTFEGLVGINGGLLSYDFYLSDFNLLIEYQGEFHDGNGNYFIKQNLKTQQEHDSRKKQYVLDNNINLLEIWYYDFENIEKILDNLCLKEGEGA